MKIQILELPMEHVGDYSTTPYAIILSEVDKCCIETYGKGMDSLKGQIEGLKWYLVTSDEVEV